MGGREKTSSIDEVIVTDLASVYDTPSIYTFRATRVIDLSDDTRTNESLERDFTRNELRDHPSLPDREGNLRPCRSPSVKDGPFDRDKMIPPPSFWPI